MGFDIDCEVPAMVNRGTIKPYLASHGDELVRRWSNPVLDRYGSVLRDGKDNRR